MSFKHSWSAIDRALKCTAEAKAIEAKYYSKEINLLLWCKECVDLYKKFGLTERKMQDIIGGLTLNKGALETISELKARGIKIGIISGGIYNMYEYASKEFGLSADYVSFAAKLDFDKGGKLIGGEYNPYDFEGKVHVLKLYCKKAKVPLDETLYVGDSHNDIGVFKVATGIAFSSDSEELKKYAKYIIKGDDLREILDYVT